MIDWIIQTLIMAIARVIDVIQPFLSPISFVAAWALIGIAIWSVVSFFREGLNRAKKMHTIPCANCRYFTDDHRLKCPVHPGKAMSEAAINCMDFEDQSFGVYS